MQFLDIAFTISCVAAALVSTLPFALLLMHCMTPFIEQNKSNQFFF